MRSPSKISSVQRKKLLGTVWEVVLSSMDRNKRWQAKTHHLWGALVSQAGLLLARGPWDGGTWAFRHLPQVARLEGTAPERSETRGVQDTSGEFKTWMPKYRHEMVVPSEYFWYGGWNKRGEKMMAYVFLGSRARQGGECDYRTRGVTLATGGYCVEIHSEDWSSHQHVNDPQHSDPTGVLPLNCVAEYEGNGMITGLPRMTKPQWISIGWGQTVASNISAPLRGSSMAGHATALPDISSSLRTIPSMSSWTHGSVS